jgi:predicted dehydrogenase
LIELSGAFESERPVRVAVAGLGYWGPNLARVLEELEEASVVALCDSSPTAVQRVARRHPQAACFTSFEELLDEEDVDAIAIATPVYTHYELAKAALDAGKHVFVEKPLAGSSTEAESLIAQAQAAGLTLMPGHTFLYSPPVNLVRDLIQRGELGEIYFVSTSRVNLGIHQSDVSVVWDLAPHDLSILRHWLGQSPDRVSAMARACVDTRPDVAFVSLSYDSGTIAHAEFSWLAPSKLRRTTVVGSEKMVVYDDTSTEPVRVFDSGASLGDPQSFGEFRLTYRSGDIVSPRIEAVEPLQLELLDFCRAIEGGQPIASTELALDVVRTIEAVDRSLELDGAMIPVEGGSLEPSVAT